MADEQAALLRAMQMELEEQILFAVQNFERRTTMTVRAIRVFRGEVKNGHRVAKAIEVDAQLK